MEQIEPSKIFAVYFLLKFMAIKWLNRAEITLGFGPKNYVFRCASRKENGLFELVFVKVQCNWLWQGTNWAIKNICSVFLAQIMAIKWLNRAEITLGFGPKNYVFRCASRKENGLFELVFVKVQCNWLWQGTNWAKKTGRKVESTLKRSLLFYCRQQ